MKVYLAMSCPEGELNGLQIFSTKEKAIVYTEKENKKGVFSSSYGWYVKECELDKENLEV